jgi:predicted 3-demethylubiquinone-9 3-methyltransferase (glyoxalase superfamily)
VVGCETVGEVDSLWARLREGGTELMPLDAYPFGERYAWIQDRYGLSWQLLYNGGRRVDQKITPALMFVGAQCGKAGEAMRFYTSVFRNAQIDEIIRYGPNEEPDKPGSIKQAAFSLEGQRFTAMDSAYDHGFSFNEAISLMVYCENQAELDYYWGRLSAFPEDEQCGWLKDKFGVSWQVVPTIMDELMREKDPAKRRRFTEAMLKMKKLDIAELQRTQL